MFKIENNKISITRGDIAVIGLTIDAGDGTNYVFQPGDVVRFKVFAKNDVEDVKKQKDIKIVEETEELEFELTKEDTTIDDFINRPAEYWFEIELNPDTNPQTVIGYDEEGPKTFTLYPEGSEKND